MGIESDQLVFDYLSRVGDLAQQQQLPSQARMRLVASLRGEIERRRGKSDTPESVRRILTRLGTPDEVVSAASSGGGLAVPSQRTAASPESPADAPAAHPVEAGGSPHLAGMDEVGSGDFQPDWWRVEDVPAGFHGGVEIPEMLKPPPKEEAEAAEAGPPADAAPAGARRLLRLRPRRGRKAAAEAAPAAPPAPPAPVRSRVSHPMLLLAAVLLVAGAVLGSWLPLAGGWLLAYGSRRLSPREAKWVVMGLPGLVAAAAVVWLWGRTDGRWGEPLPAGGGAMSEALAGTWPWVVRGAAVASALYLAWRARRS
ncbi:hypothetical protein ACF1G0_07970 [Streptomyces sp. NPDC013953]|uniref:hypothetical protein n=1 Tax=Streptomyces sp. NPDC013953 TaxID=3364868 RepID=UPI0036F83D26